MGTTHPDEQLGHDDVSQLTGSVQSRTRQRGGPGLHSVDLVLGAVGQEQQQSGQIPIHHCGQQPRRHTVLPRLVPRGWLKGRHKLPLVILRTDPRLPFFPGERAADPVRCKTEEPDFSLLNTDELWIHKHGFILCWRGRTRSSTLALCKSAAPLLVSCPNTVDLTGVTVDQTCSASERIK